MDGHVPDIPRWWPARLHHVPDMLGAVRHAPVLTRADNPEQICRNEVRGFFCHTRRQSPRTFPRRVWPRRTARRLERKCRFSTSISTISALNGTVHLGFQDATGSVQRGILYIFGIWHGFQSGIPPICIWYNENIQNYPNIRPHSRNRHDNIRQEADSEHPWMHEPPESRYRRLWLQT